MSFSPYQKLFIKLIGLVSESSHCAKGAFMSTILIYLVLPNNDSEYVEMAKTYLLFIFILLFFCFKILEGTLPGFCMTSEEKSIDHQMKRSNREND